MMTPPAWPRVIVHADMDAFFAAVEVLDDPSLRGKPVLVGHPGRRGVVTTASYEARPFGVGSAMSMAEAMRRCPEALVVPPRHERYAEVSRQVMSVFETFSPVVEPLSLDEAFLDLTGTERLFGPPDVMGRRLKQAVRDATGGLAVSVGIAATKYVAKVASDHDKPDGLTIVAPEATLRFLAPLPVSRLWGVGPKAQERLAALGLSTIGEVGAVDPAQLRARLGSLGSHISRLSRGLDPRPVVGDRSAKSIGAEETLAFDVRGKDAIRPHLRRLAERVARRMRNARRPARGVRVKLKTNRFQLHTRQTVLREAVDTDAELMAAAERLLDEFDLAEPMRLVGIAAFQLSPPGGLVQQDLFAAAGRRRRQSLERTMDAVRERFGDRALLRAAESGRPGGASVAELLDRRRRGGT